MIELLKPVENELVYMEQRMKILEQLLNTLSQLRIEKESLPEKVNDALDRAISMLVMIKRP